MFTMNDEDVSATSFAKDLRDANRRQVISVVKTFIFCVHDYMYSL